MASLVRDFQRDIVQSSKGTTELLRTAKLIAAKLNLPEISEWVGRELTGYPSDGSRIPPYRIIAGGMLMALNPVRGWQSAGHVNRQFPIIQSMPELEKLASEKSIVMPLTGENRYRLDGIANNFSQQVELSTVQLTGIISAVRDRLLDWSTELEGRGILGNEMAFDPQEKESARSQVFHIQNFTGVFGDVANSTVQIYDYSSLHQMLKQQEVPQAERNELENIMDELKTASASKKQPLLDRAKTWVTKNADFLGAAVGVVRKALGLGDDGE